MLCERNQNLNLSSTYEMSLMECSDSMVLQGKMNRICMKEKIELVNYGRLCVLCVLTRRKPTTS